MTTFLFWNTSKKALEEKVINLVKRHDVDVLMLVESTAATATMLERLNEGGPARFHLTESFSDNPDILIYTAFPREFTRPLFDSSRLTIRTLSLPGQLEILLAVAHLPSKLYWSEASQNMECVEVARAIRVAEENAGHTRTVLTGDLNMNPFEEGVVGAAGLHAVMSRTVASKKFRTIQKRQYPFFYNPMWGEFGDANDSPSGTYYYERAEHIQFFWNMFDQVLIRPQLLPHFKRDKLRILRGDGSTSFLDKKGVPDKATASDHLPLLFQLTL